MIQAASPDAITSMGWKGCALLVASAGALGGLLNAYFTDHGLKRPTVMNGVWCPGAIGNIVVGLFRLWFPGLFMDLARVWKSQPPVQAHEN